MTLSDSTTCTPQNGMHLGMVEAVGFGLLREWRWGGKPMDQSVEWNMGEQRSGGRAQASPSRNSPW